MLGLWDNTQNVKKEQKEHEQKNAKCRKFIIISGDKTKYGKRQKTDRK